MGLAAGAANCPAAAKSMVDNSDEAIYLAAAAESDEEDDDEEDEATDYRDRVHKIQEWMSRRGAERRQGQGGETSRVDPPASADPYPRYFQSSGLDEFGYRRLGRHHHHHYQGYRRHGYVHHRWHYSRHGKSWRVHTHRSGGHRHRSERGHSVHHYHPGGHHRSGARGSAVRHHAHGRVSHAKASHARQYVNKNKSLHSASTRKKRARR